MGAGGFLHDPVLERIGVEHGFGTRGAEAPDDLVRVRQVHGTRVAAVDASGRAAPAEADAIVCHRGAWAVGVVTADCVPVLIADASGAAVAAVHAGWRGLAAGVVTAAIDRLVADGAAPAALSAAIGPHARSCCYEVDAPVIAPLAARFGEALARARRPSRPGHDWLDLAPLVGEALLRAGLSPERIGEAAAPCTICDGDRFESFRRDGEAAGRMVHWIRRAGARAR